MSRQAFGRACGTLISTLVLSLALAACGGSDEGGDSTKSPDLPAPQASVTLNCPTTLPVGVSGQCSASCTTTSVDKNGNRNTSTGCPSFRCESQNDQIAEVVSSNDAADSCQIRGVSENIVDIVGISSVGNGSDTVQITNAAITQFEIQPDTMTLPVGVSQQAQAFGDFTDGVTRQVTTSTNWVSATPAVAAVGNANPVQGLVTGVMSDPTAVTVTGTYIPDNNYLDTLQVTVNDAVIVNGGLCVMPAPAGYAFNAAAPCIPLAQRPACAPGNTVINLNQTQQFVAFGEFTNGDSCDLTRTVDWSLNPLITNADIDTIGPDFGLVTAGDTTGSTNVTAVFTHSGGTETGSAPLTIGGGGRIAANSLNVGIPVEDTNNDGVLNGADDLQKVVCLGAYDLVQGLQESDDLPAAKQTYANHRICQDGGTSGDCDEADFGSVVTPVNQTINLVEWTIGGDYFTGGQCVTSDTGPVGADNDPPAVVGSTTDFTLPETDDPAIKGNISPTGELRIGTACVEGTLTINGVPGSSTDGLTAIILPATSDEVLGQAVQLCNTLVPLFLLGGDEGAGATVQLVAAVSDILNPLLLALGEGGLDDVLNTVLTQVSDNLTSEDTGALSPLLTPILGDVVQGIVDENVFSPVNCALGTLLQGLLGGDPSEIAALAECAPDPSNFAPSQTTDP